MDRPREMPPLHPSPRVPEPTSFEARQGTPGAGAGGINVIHCDRCKMKQGEALTFEIKRCCDFGEYLLELVERCQNKRDPQLRWGARGDLYQESSFGIGKLTKADWRRLYSK